MDYKNCSEVEQSYIHQAFLNGFSDYSVPMNISLDLFVKRFFGPEGNSVENSFIAFQDDEPVGLVLGGIREFDGYKNLRCGALCVTPEYRGADVGKELFRLFAEQGISQSCERISLEVISDNIRAIRFYEKQGFIKNNKLIYFSHSLAGGQIKDYSIDGLLMNEVNLSIAVKVRESISTTHINWQNEVDYFQLDSTAHCFAAYAGERLLGTLVLNEEGKIYFLYTEEGERQKGVASSLLSYAISKLDLQKLNINMPDNIDMTEFLHKTGFTKEKIEQFEMIKVI